MAPGFRITTAVVKVLAAFVEHPGDDRYGLDLIRDTGLPSGTLYPILTRLERAGWVEGIWEQIDPVAEGRPARRYYRLTPTGAESARHELAALYQQLSKADTQLGKPRTA
jgi:DNA-binding PadR family transcriptional regulator